MFSNLVAAHQHKRMNYTCSDWHGSEVAGLFGRPDEPPKVHRALQGRKSEVFGAGDVGGAAVQTRKPRARDIVQECCVVSDVCKPRRSMLSICPNVCLHYIGMVIFGLTCLYKWMFHAWSSRAWPHLNISLLARCLQRPASCRR